MCAKVRQLYWQVTDPEDPSSQKLLHGRFGWEKKTFIKCHHKRMEKEMHFLEGARKENTKNFLPFDITCQARVRPRRSMKLFSDRAIAFLFEPGENRSQNQTSQIRLRHWERRRDRQRALCVGEKKICWKESFARKLHRREKIFRDSASKIFSLIALYLSHVISLSRLKY